MKFKSKTVVEISGRYLKIFQSSLAKDKPLSFGEVVNIEKMTDDGIAQQLINLRKNKSFNLQNSQVILSIPRQYAILRYLDLPSDNKEELRSMVELQAVNHFPYAQDELVLDFMLLEKNAEGYTKVLVAAVSKEILQRFEKILEDGGINPQSMTLSFVGIWNWYKKNCSSYKGISAVVDIDFNGTEICFCDQHKVLMSRPTNLGVKEIEAQQYEKFWEQLDWTITTYVKEQLGHPIGQIVLLSSVGSIEELKTYLQKKCSAPIQTIRTAQDVSMKKSFVWPNILLQEWVSVTAIVGLLKATEKSPIDLTPKETRDIQAMSKDRMQWIRLGIIVLIALVSVGVCFSLNFFKKNSQLQDLENQLRNTQKQVAVIKKKESQINVLKESIIKRIVLMDVIEEIYRLLPQSVVLTNLSLNQEHALSVQGYTNRVGDINDMQKGFVESSYFVNVNLDYVNKRVTLEGEVNYFKMTIRIKTQGKANDEAQ